MADVKISGLPAANALAAADTFEVVQGGVNKKATGAQVRALVVDDAIDPGQANKAPSQKAVAAAIAGAVVDLMALPEVGA